MNRQFELVGLALVLGAMLLFPRPGLAESPPGDSAVVHLDKARTYLSTGEWSRALEAGNRAFAGLTSLNKAQRLELHQVRAEAALGGGQRELAASLLDILLAAHPAFVAPDTWQVTWKAALKEAVRRRPDTDSPVGQPDPLLPLSHGQPLTVALELTDRSGVRSAVLRVLGTNILISLKNLPATSIWQATIPAEATAGQSMSFWVEATDTLGNRGPVWGSSVAPVIVPILKPVVVEPEAELAEQWWFWTIIGVGVVGIAAGLVAVLYDPVTPVRLPIGTTP